MKYLIYRNPIYIIVLLFLITGCEALNTTDPQSSKNIKDSKSNGVFISKYEPNINKIESDTLKFEIVEAWSENIWYYDNLFGKRTILDKPQLVIKVDSLNFEEYDIIKYKNELGYTSSGDGGKLTSRRSKLEEVFKFNLSTNNNILLRKIED